MLISYPCLKCRYLLSSLWSTSFSFIYNNFHKEFWSAKRFCDQIKLGNTGLDCKCKIWLMWGTLIEKYWQNHSSNKLRPNPSSHKDVQERDLILEMTISGSWCVNRHHVGTKGLHEYRQSNSLSIWQQVVDYSLSKTSLRACHILSRQPLRRKSCVFYETSGMAILIPSYVEHRIY
jgi:hypothetical protein